MDYKMLKNELLASEIVWIVNKTMYCAIFGGKYLW